MSQLPTLTVSQQDASTHIFTFGGVFEVENWQAMQKAFQAVDELALPGEGNRGAVVIFDGGALGAVDTFGAWLMTRLWNALEAKGISVSLRSMDDETQAALDDLKDFSPPAFVEQGLLGTRSPQNWIAKLGFQTLRGYGQLQRGIAFMGGVILSIGACLRHPRLFRYKSFINAIDATGVQALPIIGLVSLLIGIVLVYQGVSQLERFGAQIYTVNLLAISILRELGILMTAIVVAGRSGSAFTAQIGFMKQNQELDAMKVMGLDPYQLLVVPRVVALMIVMPLLTVYCDLVALTGGALMSMSLIDLSPSQFLTQLQSAISPSTFWVGIIKAPVFAFVIAVIGCYEGLQVSGGSESVGRRTTASVVKSIFTVIVLNAFFSVLFAELKV